MTRPVINLDEIVEFDDVEENGIYTSKRALFSARIGAWQLGYNLTVLPPGKVQCPFHSHPLTNQASDELHVRHPQNGDGRKWHSSTIDRRAEHGSSDRVLQTSIFAASARLKASRLTNSTAVILLRVHAPPDIEGPDEITCQVGAKSGALYNSEHQVPTCVRRIAYCHLLLQGSRWMPVSVNRKLGPNDRCSPNGAVISAFLSAAIDRDTIVGWLKNSAFSIREVRPDGSLSGLDFRAAALVTHADEVDMEARRSGAVGITSLIAQRRVQEQNAGGLPVELREAAFERAAIQILDKLQGHSVVGVLLLDC